MRKAIPLKAIVLMLFCAAAHWSAAAPLRTTTDLMGEWLLMPVADGNTMGNPPPLPETVSDQPQPNEWRKVTFPGAWRDGQSTGAWLARQIVVGEDLTGKSARLRFDSIGFAVRAFVNGILCGFDHSGYAPVEFDVTKALKPGTNIIHLAVTTYSLYPSIHATGMHIFQSGVVGQDGKTIAMWQRAELVISPNIYIASVFARPDTAKKRLFVDVEIVNKSGALAVAELATQVRDGQRTAFTLEPERVFLRVGQTQVVTLCGHWKNPRLWWPHDPHLYSLTTQLRSLDGQVQDEDAVRFGFRDLTIAGVDFRLNGKKLVMRGDSWTRYTGVYTNKAQARAFIDNFQQKRHVNALRLHVDSMEQYVLDAADEAGVLLHVQTPIAAGGGSISDPAAWDILTSMFLRYVKLSRNHPSVAIWGVANEAGGMRPWNPTAGSPFIAEKIRKTKAIDPTRPATSAHDYTMLGASELMDLPTQWTWISENIFPFCARRWVAHGYDLSPYQFDRPMVNDEWCEGRLQAGTAAWFGDKAYICPDRGGDVRGYWSAYGQALSCYMGMIEHRRQPYWCVIMPFGDRYGFFKTPYEYVADEAMIEFGQRSLKPAIVAPKDWNGGAWAGENYRRPMILMNDNFFDLSCRIQWTVTNAHGRMLARGARSFKIPATTHQDFDLSFRMPPSTTPAHWHLNLKLEDRRGNVLYEDRHELGVLPRPDFRKLAPVVLWPAGGTLAALSADRLPLHYQVSATLPATNVVVIVPRGVVVRPSQWRQLDEWVRAGGAALILADRSLPASFAGTELRSSGFSSVIGHVRRPDHPVVAGLPQPALRYWVGAAGEFDSIPYQRKMPHFLISEIVLRRPTAGTSFTLIDSSGYAYQGTSGLMQALLAEVGAGKGRALFTSLLLAEGLASDLGTGEKGEPAAGWLLHRCIAYLQDRPSWPGVEPKPLFVVGADLSRYAVATTPNLAEACAILINCASEEGRTFLARPDWLTFARNGGNVVLHNVAANQAADLSQALGVKFEAQAVVGVHRLDLTAAHPLLSGISHYDVNWIAAAGLDMIAARHPILSVSLSHTNGAALSLTGQGAIWAVPIGSGCVLMDQLRWDEEIEDAEVRRRADQYITQLLSNLGASGTVLMQAVSDEAPTADDRTIALYHFEDEDNLPRLMDYGPRSGDMTAAGEARLGEGRFRKGLYLPGGKAHARTGAYGLQTPELTYDFWIKPEGPIAESGGIIFASWRASGRADNSIVLIPDGRLGVNIAGVAFDGKTPLQPDRWTRVTITISQQHNRTRFYLDGQLDREIPSHVYYPYGINGFGNPFPGEVDSTLWNMPRAFRGTLDEFRMLDYEWTPEENSR